MEKKFLFAAVNLLLVFFFESCFTTSVYTLDYNGRRKQAANNSYMNSSIREIQAIWRTKEFVIIRSTFGVYSVSNFKDNEKISFKLLTYLSVPILGCPAVKRFKY